MVNLLRPEVCRDLTARPERLYEMVDGNPARRDVVVDEVQRVPELLHVVHDLLERPDAPRFVLTGSSARKLRRGGVNLLAGRATLRTLHPFMAAELEVLEDLLVAYRLPVFTKRALRATVAHPKFYFFDAGVYRSLRPTGPLERPSEIDGAALEGLVAQHLRAWIAYTPEAHELFYWRTRSGVEVDFVVYGSTHFFAVEVKNSDRVRRDDLRGLLAFRKDYPECRPILLHRGPGRLEIDAIPCWPVEDFLGGLRPGDGGVPGIGVG